jgi:hypothetical protein
MALNPQGGHPVVHDHRWEWDRSEVDPWPAESGFQYRLITLRCLECGDPVYIESTVSPGGEDLMTNILAFAEWRRSPDGVYAATINGRHVVVRPARLLDGSAGFRCQIDRGDSKDDTEHPTLPAALVYAIEAA